MSEKHQQFTSATAQQGFARRGPHAYHVEKPKDGRSALRRLVSYFIAERIHVVLLGAVVVISVIAGIAAPAVQSTAIDTITDGYYENLGQLLILMAALYLIYGVMTLLQGYLSAKIGKNIVRQVRSDLFAKINSLPVSYLDSHSHGDLMSRMTNDAENISNVISSSLSSLFSGILTLIGTFLIMLYYSIPLTLLTCITVVFMLIFTKFITKKMRKYFTLRQQLLGKLNGTVEEMVTASHTVAAYSREESIISSFTETADDLTKTGIIAEIIGSSMGPVSNMISNCAFVIVSVFGAWFALNGWITIGVISAFIVYSKQFSRPINEIAQLYGQLQTALAGSERIFAVLDEDGEDLSGDLLPEKIRGVIDFRHVNFSYVPEKQVINDFSLKIESGKKIALVGSTGSGKTTIINLLMRFYDIDSGEILLDGKDIRTIARRSLRDAIGIVLQDTVLFSDTVRSNLAYGKPDASDAELEDAAEFANAKRMIENLPDGYDTELSESGVSLSQGQRQLLAIGRAYLSDPQILILDEATSSVDTRTEKHIQDAMSRLMKDRTSLIIAHRISTIRDADEIIVMDRGRIVEQGNHVSLMGQKGRYYELYMTQFAGQAT